MKTYREEDDFPLLQALLKAKVSTAKELKRLFNASSGFDNDRLLTFAQQLYLASDFTPQGVPGITDRLRDRTKVELMPIFAHYAKAGDQWSSQILEHHYSSHGLRPDRGRQKYWAGINARNETLPNSHNLGVALFQKNFARAQKMYDAGVRTTPGFLINMIANANLKTVLWILNQPGHLELDLDAQDKYPVAANEEYLSTLTMRTDNPFPWQKGRHLRNTALILALKKGWDRGEGGRNAEPRMGDVAERLLELGANPNVQDGCGNTALHIAVLHRDARAIRALLKAGADKTLVNTMGLTAADMLHVDYDDLDPFLYRQTGHDTICYIHTLMPRNEWEKAGPEVARLLGVPPPPAPAPAGP